MKKKKIVKPSQPTDLEYIKMFDECVIDLTKTGTIDKVIDDHVSSGRNRYTDISDQVTGNALIKPVAFTFGYSAIFSVGTFFTTAEAGRYAFERYSKQFF